jgi:F-type H+-transporting ATPase subunit b
MQFSWWTLIIQAANFLVLVWLLNRLLYRPVREVIEKRQKLIQQAETEVEKARAEADVERGRYQDALAAIDQEQQKAMAAAHQQIETERQAIVDEARAKADREIGEAREEIAAERRAAVEASREEVTGLAVAMARMLLSDLTRGIPNSAILNRIEAEIEALPSRERERLGRDIAKNGGALEVVTAGSLSADERKIWQASLERILQHPLDLTFKHDPDLLSGAVLHLPHTSVDTSLSDRLTAAKEALLRGSVAYDT